MHPTIRERLLKELRDWLIDMTEEDPVEDPYGLTLSRVVLGPLGDADKRKHVSVSIVTGQEIKQERYPLVENTLPIDVAWQYMLQTGEGDAWLINERVLGTLQRRVQAFHAEKPNGSGDFLVLMREVGNVFDLETATDKTLEGVAFFELVYRHDHHDPRTLGGKLWV